MSDQLLRIPRNRRPESADPLRVRSWALLAAAGLYVGSWVTGLTVAPAAPAPFAGVADVQAYFVTHSESAALQSTLVHGLAGAALVVVVLAVANALPGGVRGWSAGFGLLAVGASAVQMVLMFALVARVEETSATTTTALFDAINQVDSVKLLLLGCAVATATIGARRNGLFPSWLVWVGALLAPLLPLSGAAFLIPSDLLFATLYLSLPLLLVWVAAAAITVAQKRKD